MIKSKNDNMIMLEKHKVFQVLWRFLSGGSDVDIDKDEYICSVLLIIIEDNICRFHMNKLLNSVDWDKYTCVTNELVRYIHMIVGVESYSISSYTGILSAMFRYIFNNTRIKDQLKFWLSFYLESNFKGLDTINTKIDELTLMLNQHTEKIQELEDAIKFAPNSKTFEEAKTNFETLSK